jgi:hypothetical protein
MGAPAPSRGFGGGGGGGFKGFVDDVDYQSPYSGGGQDRF